MVTGWDADTSLGPLEFFTADTLYSPDTGSNPTERISLGYWLILPRILVRPAGLVVSRSVTWAHAMTAHCISLASRSSSRARALSRAHSLSIADVRLPRLSTTTRSGGSP